jgi:hypothetical protein
VPKLKLEIEELKVESFAVLPYSTERAGTVHGRSVENLEPISGYACDGGGGGGGYTEGTCIGPTFCCAPTWRPSCMPTCANTCQLTCLDGLCTWIC